MKIALSSTLNISRRLERDMADIRMDFFFYVALLRISLIKASPTWNFMLPSRQGPLKRRKVI